MAYTHWPLSSYTNVTTGSHGSVAGMRPSFRRGHPGFSLIELLVVLAIITAIAVISTPRLLTSYQSFGLRQAARELVLALKKARLQALRSGRQTEFILHLDHHQYSLGKEGARHALAGDIDLTLTTAASERIDASAGAVRFYPDGGSSGGQIRLERAGREIVIRVDWLTGRIRVGS